MSARLLIVDDEESLLQFLELMFSEIGYEVTTASGVEEAKRRLSDSGFDLVLCDITMPDGSGLDLLREIRSDEDRRTAVIMMTAYTSTESAVEAMKAGAYDYVSKPFDVEELKLLVERALEKTELYQENVYLRRELQERYTFSNIIGRSGRMQSIFALVERISRTPSTVLIRGESGTGKELIARAIHFNSPRSRARFLSINCGALPENLLESELFGHERGSFTGAVREKQGLFQEASGGTLFLDEIGEMTPSMQVKLLRALQEKKVRRVGGTREEDVDVRIIAATNQDLEEQIRNGSFREDLFYRINVIPIHLPALRRRREDIPLLADHFVRKYSSELGTEPVRFSVEAMRMLERYEWPGNVRELENVVERTLALQSGSVVTASDLPAIIANQSEPDEEIRLPEEGLDLEQFLDDIRRRLMSEALDRCDGVQTQAAELLGMSFRSFRYYAKKMQLAPTRDD
ncbi:MAG: sigma-54-dependent Fis family transcriptional regulator [Acidobacteria bacterium]|nr:MAG: sigma-54-dependent Fis family transcriptional regulator [Acidobacteriota bacterium]REK12092.1 MAG: sigma-54-dependent Fis family transcriptional regulator [Acidobacteriota bacterium]